MTRVMKLALVCALVVGAPAGTAHAAAWNTNGVAAPGTAFTGVSVGPATTNFANGVAVTCAATTIAGNLFGPTLGTGVVAATITPTYAGCRSAGVAVTKACQAGNVTPDGYDTHVTPWNPMTTNGYTVRRWTWNCTLTLGGTATTVVTGQVVAAYGNATLSTTNGPTNPIGAQIGARSLQILASELQVTGGTRPLAPVGTAVQENAPAYVINSRFVPNINWA